MALSRNIQLSFWTDSKIIDDFTPEDRYFYLYLMTNPHTNLCGCYEISVKQMADEMGYSRETVEKLIERMLDYHRVIDYSRETKEILLVNWHKYNWVGSGKLRVALENEIARVKNPHFHEFLSKALENENEVYIPYGYPIASVNTNTLYANTLNTETQNTNTQNTESPKPRKRLSKFEPPEVSEVQEYCREKGYNIDVNQFVDYYSAQGWYLSNGRKMVDWKAAVRRWASNNNSSGYGNAKTTWNRKETKKSDLDYFLSQAGGVIYDERRNSEVVIGNEGDVQ